MYYETGHPDEIVDDIVNYVAEQNPYTYTSRTEPIMDYMQANGINPLLGGNMEAILAAALFIGENGIGTV